jgi:hypothetical protein
MMNLTRSTTHAVRANIAGARDQHFARAIGIKGNDKGDISLGRARVVREFQLLIVSL